MTWLNYHHLLYFWTVAREGGLVPASKVLRLSHPTLSTQIRALENQLGEKLFQKSGRKLALTDVGRVVYRYADEIFTLGREMVDTVQDRATGQPLRLNVGIVDAVPKLIARRLLQPVFAMSDPVRLICHEGPHERLLADLALHTLDVVISDGPIGAGSSVRGFNHLLAETGTTLFGARTLARDHKRRFPRSLDGAPMLLPLETLSLRRALNHWLDRQQLKPRVVAEFADSALLKVFGGEGLGIFPGPSAIEREICEQYGVDVIGRVPEARERFYAISSERKLKHPAVVAISEAAREELDSRRPH